MASSKLANEKPARKVSIKNWVLVISLIWNALGSAGIIPPFLRDVDWNAVYDSVKKGE